MYKYYAFGGYKLIESIHFTEEQSIPVYMMSNTGKYRGIKKYRRFRIPSKSFLVDHDQRIVIAHPATINKLRKQISTDVQGNLDSLTIQGFAR